MHAADAAAGDADAAPHGGALPTPRHGAGVRDERRGRGLRHGPAFPVPADGNAAGAVVRRARAGDAATGRGGGVRSHDRRAARADGSCSCAARSRSRRAASPLRHTGSCKDQLASCNAASVSRSTHISCVSNSSKRHSDVLRDRAIRSCSVRRSRREGEEREAIRMLLQIVCGN